MKKILDIVRNFAKSCQLTIFWLFDYGVVLGSTTYGRSTLNIDFLRGRFMKNFRFDASILQHKPLKKSLETFFFTDQFHIFLHDLLSQPLGPFFFL